MTRSGEGALCERDDDDGNRSMCDVHVSGWAEWIRFLFLLCSCDVKRCFKRCFKSGFLVSFFFRSQLAKGIQKTVVAGSQKKKKMKKKMKKMFAQ